MLRQVIDDALKEVGTPVVSSKNSGAKRFKEEGNALYTLKETLEEQFDPTFWHASSKDQQKAISEIEKNEKERGLALVAVPEP